MNVLHICSFYTNSMLYKNLIEKLEEVEVDNIVYIPCKRRDIYKNISNNRSIKYFYSEIFKNGNNVIEKIGNVMQKVLFYQRENKMVLDIEKKIQLEEVNIIHAHSLFIDGYVAYQLKKKKNIDYVVAVRNMDLNVMMKYLFYLRKDAIKILSNAKKIIFISPTYKENFIVKYIPSKMKSEILQKSIVVPNGIDKYWIENALKNERVLTSNKKVNLIFVGRINKNKNITTLIEVANKMNLKGYECKLNIIGNGELLDEYKKKYENEDIIFCGQLDKEKIIEYYKSSDIFVMCSKYETFGLVYVEAMSQGLPVIYTKNQGFDNYFPNGFVGFSVNYNDTHEITEKIESIISQYKQISENCINCYKGFNWENVCKDYKHIYMEEK